MFVSIHFVKTLKQRDVFFTFICLIKKLRQDRQSTSAHACIHGITITVSHQILVMTCYIIKFSRISQQWLENGTK